MIRLKGWVHFIKMPNLFLFDKFPYGAFYQRKRLPDILVLIYVNFECLLPY